MSEGTKYDQGKNRFDLLPLDALWEVGQVYTMGAGKYEERNWEKGIKYGRVLSALCRHLFKWWCGEKYDVEDGQNHLSSVVWCGLALLHYDLNASKYSEYDDRPTDHIKVWNNEKPPAQCKEFNPLSSNPLRQFATGMTTGATVPTQLKLPLLTYNYSDDKDYSQ